MHSCEPSPHIEGASAPRPISVSPHVAQLAGVPRTVLDRAKVILQTLESDHLDDTGKTKVPERPTKQKREQQRTLFAPEEHPVMDELRHLDLNNLTPLAALQELNRLKGRLK